MEPHHLDRAAGDLPETPSLWPLGTPSALSIVSLSEPWTACFRWKLPASPPARPALRASSACHGEPRNGSRAPGPRPAGGSIAQQGSQRGACDGPHQLAPFAPPPARPHLMPLVWCRRAIPSACAACPYPPPHPIAASIGWFTTRAALLSLQPAAQSCGHLPCIETCIVTLGRRGSVPQAPPTPPSRPQAEKEARRFP